LPASTLPDPVAPERSARARTAVAARSEVDEGPIQLKDPAKGTVDIAEPDDLVVEAEIDWDDEAAAGTDGGDLDEVDRRGPRKPAAVPDQGVDRRSQPTRPAPRQAASGVPASPAQAARRRPATLEPGPGARVPDAETLPGTSDLARPRTARGPGRRPLVVLACVVMLVLGSLAWRTLRQRWADLPQVARIGQTEGIAALEEGKFDHAHQLLSAAKVAVDGLRGAVEGADEIRTAAAEAAIFANLLNDSLENLLDEAARKPEDWPYRFNTRYKGRAVIIDATITAAPDTPGSHGYELDYLVLAPGQGVQERRFARIDLSGFEAITKADRKVGHKVTFGARLAAFEYDAAAEGWVIRFEPETGVCIKHTKALESMGWPTASFHADEGPEGSDSP
jgi:hypothetical protein